MKAYLSGIENIFLKLKRRLFLAVIDTVVVHEFVPTETLYLKGYMRPW